MPTGPAWAFAFRARHGPAIRRVPALRNGPRDACKLGGQVQSSLPQQHGARSHPCQGAQGVIVLSALSAHGSFCFD
jgi:hypothetical protein